MTEWRKSSRSGGFDNSDCVEVADLGGCIGVRDSKAPENGNLTVTVERFADLLLRVRRGELDL